MSVIRRRMTQAVVCIVHVRTCKLVRHLSESKFTFRHNHSYIYDFDPKAMLSNAGL